MNIKLATVVAVLVAAALGCSNKPRNGTGRPSNSNNVAAVEVVKAQHGSLPLQYRLSGTVRSSNQVVIHPEISGNVVGVVVQTGDRVEAGDPLVYVRDVQIREQVQQAEASLQAAIAERSGAESTLKEIESRLERTRQLASQKYQSEQELETLTAQVAAAEASVAETEARVVQARAILNERREQLEQTVVRAPVSGNVGRRNVEVGMRIDPSTPLFVIGSLDMMRVDVFVPDEMVGRIRPGQTALISSRSLGDQILQARVSRISPFLQPGSFSAAAEVDVPEANGFLLPGMFVTVDVLYGESQQATLVPTSALYEDPASGMLGVVTAPSLGLEIPVEAPEEFDSQSPPPLLEETPMQFQPVDVLARGGDAVGITGVDPDQWVVVVGQHLLQGIAEDRVAARARPVPWARVSSLQDLQDEDLLRQFMAKQQRLSREAFGGTQTSDTTEQAASAASSE